MVNFSSSTSLLRLFYPARTLKNSFQTRPGARDHHLASFVVPQEPSEPGIDVKWSWFCIEGKELQETMVIIAKSTELEEG